MRVPVAFMLAFVVGTMVPAPGASPTLPYCENICCILVDGANVEEVNQRWGTYVIAAEEGEDLYLLGVEHTTNLERLSKAMSLDPAIETVEPDRVIETPEAVRQMVIAAVGGTLDDFSAQDFTARVHLDLAHETSRGAGVVVAVLDTGIDRDHPLFAGRLHEFAFDTIDNDTSAGEEANGCDDDGDGMIDEAYGHGTMVAGLIALVAPEARIMPIRVLDDEGRGTIFTVARGMMKAMSHGAHLINMSFGAPRVMETIRQKLRVANIHRAITFAGAGNRGIEFPPYHPACDLLAHMVTAVDSIDIKADFSDYHEASLISAPGVAVRSAYPNGEWAVGSGCSFATPIVCGAAALLLGVDPRQSEQDLILQIGSGAEPIDGLPGNEPYAGKLGAGRIDLAGSVQAYATGVEDRGPKIMALVAWPNPSSGPMHFRLDQQAGTLRLTILDAGGRLVRQMDAGSSMRWDGLDRSGRRVAPGIYWARVESGREVGRLALTIVR